MCVASDSAAVRQPFAACAAADIVSSVLCADIHGMDVLPAHRPNWLQSVLKQRKSAQPLKPNLQQLVMVRLVTAGLTSQAQA